MADTIPIDNAPTPSITQTTRDTTSVSTSTSEPTWLYANVRNLILVAVTGVVCYLAVAGMAEARSALITTFVSIVSYLFAERAALKRPGQDT